MPVNKNAMTRYKILDELLNNRYRNYSMDDLTDSVNEALCEMGVDAVTRRCIEKDIKYLEYEGPFLVEIERYAVASFRVETQKSFAKRCLRYSDPSFSIFKKSMTDDERHLLSEALSMLGQFDGLPNLDSLENLRLSLGVGESSRVISFTKNPLENSNLLGALFTAITNRQVIEIEYCAFTIASESNKIVIHPYLLKEYNRRWYLFAAADNDDKLLSFSLDRINEVVALPSRTYIESTQDLNDHFDDIIGVTLLSDNPIEKILFWVSDISKHYVATKPLHDSQKHYQSIKEQSYREQYPMLNGGYFFSIECRKNYELIRELSSFGKELLVLSPQSIQDEVLKRLNNTLSEYEKLRT